MDYLLVFLITFFAGLNIFLSGFGLAITVTSAFLIFFPLEIAITLAALVHFLVNLVKFLTSHKKVNIENALKFGIPSIVAALAGSLILFFFSSFSPIAEYNLSDANYKVYPIKLIFAILTTFFVFFELVTKSHATLLKNLSFVGGAILSGFFGGLIGNQGVIRVIILKRAGLTKESLVATGVLIATFVDISRLLVYVPLFFNESMFTEIPLMATAVLSAFLGFVLGDQLLRNGFNEGIQKLTASLFIIIAFCLGLGII